MPSLRDSRSSPSMKGKIVKSAFDSDTFDADGSIYVEGQGGSASISPSGRDVCLASPEGLAIIDLDSPYSPPRRLKSHGLPWLVVDVQWSPFAARDYWVATTANHRCLVWNLNSRADSSSGAIEHSLQGHSRAITDINFSAHHPDLLATCSVDGYVHYWDLRRPRRPALTFCDWFAGATQVKYNRQDSHILASSHDRWLHIWDERKSNGPVKSISAHTTKIYGLDWNRMRKTGLATCSLDKSIKFWDYENDHDVPERVIRTDFPVWRARHTPFGWGLLAMPQNEPGNLHLYDRRSQPEVPQDGYVDPVASYPGHGSFKVKEFLWRSRGGLSDDGMDNREFQLVSWGEDNNLRLQTLESRAFESVGHLKGGPARKNLRDTRKGAVYKTFRTVEDGITKNRRNPTISDPRPGSNGSQYRRSAMTTGLHAPGYTTGSAWTGTSMKARTNGDKKSDKNQSQLGWMKGISMNKRRALTDTTSQRKTSKDSSFFGHNFPDNQWGEPETIQEELVRVSNRLPNVNWDNIDMDKLTLNASLKGPWGVDRDTVFIKVQVDIPVGYPKTRPPRFSIEESSFMPVQIHKKLEGEVQQLADELIKRKHNCLDPAFSFLLGEVDLESSTSFFKNVEDLDEGLDILADESSSDESDSEIPAGGSASMSQELPPHAEAATTFAPSHRSIIPPIPRTCGARFSNDGRLVCFFPSKEEKARTLLFAPPEQMRDRNKFEPSFAGFGRLSTGSPSMRPRFDEASGPELLSDGPEDSDDSISSSSSSELASMHKISLWHQPRRKFKKTWSANDSVRSSGGGTGAGTGTGTGFSGRRRPVRARNIVSVHDFSSLLPSKPEFSNEYAIFGDGADVCSHNSDVAAKFGHHDLANIWKYSALLLRSDIPLDLYERPTGEEPLLVIAKNSVARHNDRWKNGSLQPNSSELAGKVKWGHHPLAHEYIRDLFAYFEALADVQMLAMLSCIFGDASTEGSVEYAESSLTQPEVPLSMKAPSFSLQYFPSQELTWNHGKSNASSAINTPKTIHTPVYSGSHSEDGLWFGELGSNPYASGDTPPNRRSQIIESESTTQSLSTSPDTRSFRRTNSALASASNFAANLPRALTGASTSSSPPNPPSRKRPSPAETILHNLAPSTITWGSSTVFGQQSDTGTARTSVSDDESRRDEWVSTVPFGISVQQENSELFDDDGWLMTSLLEPARQVDYVSYRYAYAEMLQMWGQPLARLEIMKFNVLKKEHPDGNVPEEIDDTASSFQGSLHSHSHGHVHGGSASTHHLLGGKHEQLENLLASGRGLDVTGICQVDEMQLNPLQYTQQGTHIGGAAGTCDRCRRVQKQLFCVYCHEPVDALYPPCLGCGCASHDSCLAEWHAMGETVCPAGDECNCLKEALNGQVESWTAVKAAIDHMRLAESRRSSFAAGRAGTVTPRDLYGSRRSGAASTSGLKSPPGASDAYDDFRDSGGLLGISGGGGMHGKGDYEAYGDRRDATRSKKYPEYNYFHPPMVEPSHGPRGDGSKPSPYSSQQPASAARLSLGNRLKKSAGEWASGASRSSVAKSQSGNINSWKKPTS